jgi:pyridoxamine 5'-phosphate oxidase
MREPWEVTLDTLIFMPQEPENSPLIFDRQKIRDMRRSYGDQGLSEADIADDPISQFQRWLLEAASNPVIVEANAMVLSTVAKDGPQSRTVLLKDVTEAGFSFFTNYESNKGRAIASDPHVCLLFPWYAMERQVSIRGEAQKVSPQASAEYFSTRPWSSQIGAWASSQSRELESRAHLQARFDEFALKYPEGHEVPAPPHWGGYLVLPSSVEFWQGRYSRLHDRLIFTTSGSGWQLSRLHP